MTYAITPLAYADFEDLFKLDDDALRARGARRVIADAPGAYPCRVSLADATPGETLILANHKHLTVGSPYDATHAVYVRENAAAAALGEDETPAFLAHRLLSLRAFDQAGMMRDADVVDGPKADETLERLFANPKVAFVDIHFAKPGCFATRAERVGG